MVFLEVFSVTFITALLGAQISEAKPSNILVVTGLLHAETMPTECVNKTFCFLKHQNYPQDLIDYLLTEKFRLNLGTVRDFEVQTRQYDGEYSDCKNDPDEGLIYEIVDEEGNWRVVVQSQNLFRQGIRTEQCVEKKQLTQDSTYNFDADLLDMHELYCDEKTIDYSFLVLTHDGKGVEFAKSKSGIPIACVCLLRDKKAPFSEYN